MSTPDTVYKSLLSNPMSKRNSTDIYDRYNTSVKPSRQSSAQQQHSAQPDYISVTGSYNNTVAIKQYTTVANQSTVVIYSKADTSSHHNTTISINHTVSYIQLNDKYVVCSNKNNISVYDRNNNNECTTFIQPHHSIVLYNELMYIAVDNQYSNNNSQNLKPTINVCDKLGTIKSSITYSSVDGYPVQLSMSGTSGCLCIVTSVNTMKLYDVSGSDAHILLANRSIDLLYGNDNKQLHINHVTLNSNHSYIALSITVINEQSQQISNNVLYVYDTEIDQFYTYKFTDQCNGIQSMYFDCTRHDLLAVQINTTDNKTDDIDINDIDNNKLNDSEEYKSNDSSSETNTPRQQNSSTTSQRPAVPTIYTLFISQDLVEMTCDSTLQSTNIFLYESYITNSIHHTLSGISVPYLMFLTNQNKHAVKILRTFIGLTGIGLINELLQFNYLLGTGNSSEAYTYISQLNLTGDQIWLSLARSCIRTEYYELVGICFGQLQNSYASTVLQKLMNQPNVSHTYINAVLCLLLNDYYDAEHILKQNDQYSQLVELLCMYDRYDHAVELCQRHQLNSLIKSVYYRYAKYCEQHKRSIEQIIELYHKSSSNTLHNEIPVLCMRYDRLDLLDSIDPSSILNNYQFLGQVNESQQQYTNALKYYRQTNDVLSMVRLYITQSDYNSAETTLHDNMTHTQYRVGCMLLANEYSRLCAGDNKYVDKSIEYYKCSGCSKQALRLALQYQSYTHLIELSQYSTPSQQLHIAGVLVSQGSIEHAVLLYSQNHRFDDALHLCLSHQLYTSCNSVIGEWMKVQSAAQNPAVDNQLITSAAEYLLHNNQYNDVIQLYITAKQYSNALQCIQQYNIPINEQLCELLTPNKTKDTQQIDQRNRILDQLAELCEKHGLYSIACKKYTQRGKYTNAMNCLLKTYDTDKIIYYTQTVKKNDIYVLCANYLQTLDYLSNSDYLVKIIDYYTRTSSYAQLIQFYMVCSELEINEYRDYSKSAHALQQALDYCSKLNDVQQSDEYRARIQLKLELINSFIYARSLIHSNPNQMIEQCELLLHNSHVERGIRSGDVYALLIEYYITIEQYNESYKLLVTMSDNNIPVEQYIDKSLVENIYTKLGLNREIPQ